MLAQLGHSSDPSHIFSAMEFFTTRNYSIRHLNAKDVHPFTTTTTAAASPELYIRPLKNFLRRTFEATTPTNKKKRSLAPDCHLLWDAHKNSIFSLYVEISHVYCV